jgi:hypothetical protein
MAHDLVASFYGGYDQVGLARVRARVRTHKVPRTLLLIAIAVVALAVFVAADVAAYEALPLSIEVTSVSWESEGTILASEPGFAIHGGQSATLSLTCDSVCIKFGGATVNAPFSLLAFSVVYHPDQYTNVTVQAPTSAYSGPLTITLSVNPQAPTGSTDG